MKLQKRLSRKIGNKEYDKWIITIPPSKVQKLGWKEGQELELQIKKDKAEIKPSKKLGGAQ